MPPDQGAIGTILTKGAGPGRGAWTPRRGPHGLSFDQSGSANANSALPCADPSILGRNPSAQPPHPLGATMYCLPSTLYVEGLEWWPLPVWNIHRWSPVSASSALNSPVGSPPNTRPPAVVSSDEHIGRSRFQSQRSAPVRGSKALTEPAMSSASTATPAPQYGMLSMNSRRRRVAVAPMSCTGQYRSSVFG